MYFIDIKQQAVPNLAYELKKISRMGLVKT